MRPLEDAAHLSSVAPSRLLAAFSTRTNERAGLSHRLLNYLVRVKPLRRWPSPSSFLHRWPPPPQTHTHTQAAIGIQLRSKPVVLALASIGSSCASPSSGAIIHCRASRGKRFPIFIASTRVRAGKRGGCEHKPGQPAGQETGRDSKSRHKSITSWVSRAVSLTESWIDYTV